MNGASGNACALARSATVVPDVAAGQTFDIHDNDQLKAYVIKLFDHKKKNGATDEEALDDVIKWLSSGYMYAFTTSTPYNIEGFVNYLGQKFPRALTGQLIHDCGVYALRVAYILSGLREHPDLSNRKITFSYIKLPSHVGLLMNHEIAGAKQYMFSNGKYESVTAAELEYARGWQRGLSAQSMTAELSAHYFLPGVTAPYRLEPTEKDRSGTKEDHWQAYSAMSENAPLFVDEERQFTGSPQVRPGQASAEVALPMYMDSLAEDRELSMQIRAEYTRVYDATIKVHEKLKELLENLPGDRLTQDHLVMPVEIVRLYLEDFRRLEQLLVGVGIAPPLAPASIPTTDPFTVINNPRMWRSQHDELAGYWAGHTSAPGTTMSRPQKLSVWRVGQESGNGPLAEAIRRLKGSVEKRYAALRAASDEDLETQRGNLEVILQLLNIKDKLVKSGLMDPKDFLPPRE